MNPSPDAVTKIREYVTDWAATDGEIVASLNADTVDNPTPQGTTATPIYESALLALLTDPTNGSVVKLKDWVNFGLLKADITASNRVGIGLWCTLLSLDSTITAGECESIHAYLSATEPDPDWSAHLSWSVLNLGRAVDADDVAASRP